MITYFENGMERSAEGVYSWLLETISRDTFLNSSFNSVKILIATGKIKEATTEFKELVLFIGRNSGEFPVSYPINETMGKVGVNTVVLDLFNALLSSSLKAVKKKAVKPSPVTEEDLDKVEKAFKKKKPPITFGVNKEGKRQRAIIRVVIIQNRPQTRLIDPITKRYLGWTKSFRAEQLRIRKELEK